MPGARDGQLRIRRGADSPPWGLDLYDDAAGLWRDVAYAAGVPVLRGPYVVDVGDIPTNGSTKPLWTPAVGDVLLRLFADRQTVIQWDTGTLYIGADMPAPVDTAHAPDSHIIAAAGHSQLGEQMNGGLDLIGEAIFGNQVDEFSAPYGSSAFVFHSTDAVQIMLASTYGSDPGTGHLELYALVARAVAP